MSEACAQAVADSPTLERACSQKLEIRLYAGVEVSRTRDAYTNTGTRLRLQFSVVTRSCARPATQGRIPGLSFAGVSLTVSQLSGASGIFRLSAFVDVSTCSSSACRRMSSRALSTRSVAFQRTMPMIRL